MNPFTRRHLLTCLMAATLPAWARDASLPLMLAQTADPGIDPAGWLVSEKYDGARAFWDGRDLRFRSGLPVAAPAWFKAALPTEPLDGELWIGRGRFEALVSTVRRHAPVDDDWRTVRYMVFDLPGADARFEQRARRIEALLKAHPPGPCQAVRQQVLADRAALQAMLKAVVDGGGEGLMLHRADALFVRGRSPLLRKLKPLSDAEALVIGHVAGRGRHAGRLGALRVRTVDGVEFHIGTGFSDAQRDSPPPLGSWVSFTHQGLTGGGVPRFASYLRQRSL